GLPWASAFALGAVVSAPDVAAATAFLRRLPLPRRLVIILEGESMINDAAAIVAYRMAVAAAVTGSFSLPASSLRFLYIGTGGVVFRIEGLICIITGLALRPILGGWSGPFARDLVWGTVLVSVTVIVARFVWVFPATYLPRLMSARVRKRDPSPPWRLPAVVSWAGLRGAESLVLAAAIPTLTGSGAPF